MRSKGLLLVLLCLLCTCVFYLMVGEPSVPSTESLNFPAHSQATLDLEPPTPAHDRKVPLPLSSHVTGPQQHREHRQHVKRQQGVDENDLLSQVLYGLGFTSNPRTYPNHRWNNVTLPLFLTAVQPGQAELATAFVSRFQATFPAHHLIFNAISLEDDEFDMVNKSCHINSTVCSLHRFDTDRYPPHVSDLKLNAFRPIMIQQVLDQAGAVVWMDLNLVVWGQDSLRRFKRAVSSAITSSILSWTMEQPTSALTHPRMFQYFQTENENFYFHRMIDPACLILFNTRRVHEDLMQPWTRCALLSDCINPIGAQSSGCRFDKKPLYRYSGCHSYDTSALNVILGLMFDFNEKPYAGSDEERFFAKYDADSLPNEADIMTAGRDYESEKRNSSSPATKLSFNRSGWRISSQ